MAPPRSENPSPEAVRKRAARAAAKKANPEAYAAKARAAAALYRQRKKCAAEVAEAASRPPPPRGPCPPCPPAAKVGGNSKGSGPLVSARHLADKVAARSQVMDPEPIEHKTARAYADRLERLQSAYTGEKLGGISLELLRDVPRTWRTLTTATARSGPHAGHPWALSTQITTAAALVGTLRRLPGYEAAAEAYAELAAPLQARYDAERKQNTFASGERAKFVPWSKLVLTFDEEAAKSRSILSARDLALFGLYVAIPPRRLEDYRAMRVAKVGRQDLDPSANWLLLDAAGSPVKLVFNVYKTANRYGQYSRDTLPRRLVKVLRAHLRTARIRDGAPLFAASAGQPYTPAAFSSLVGDVFQKATGQRATANALRHSAITHFLDTKQSVAARERFAKQMGHSLQAQSLYDRLEAESEDDGPPPGLGGSRPGPPHPRGRGF